MDMDMGMGMNMDHSIADFIALGLRKLGRQCCEAALIDTHDGSRTGALCRVLKRRSPDKHGHVVRVCRRCMGSSTSYGFVDAVRSFPPPPRERLLLLNSRLEDAMAGCQSGKAWKPTTRDQTWAGVATSTMCICASRLA
eukprot:scaffold74378_cov71-Phaeocystis_antarctica.AAC.6